MKTLITALILLTLASCDLYTKEEKKAFSDQVIINIQTKTYKKGPYYKDCVESSTVNECTCYFQSERNNHNSYQIRCEFFNELELGNK